MEKITNMDDELDKKKQLAYKYTADLSTGFHYQELPSSTHETSRVLTKNVIVFMISGSCVLSYDNYVNRIFFAEDMLFFPMSATVTGRVLDDAKFLYMTFDMPLSTSDRQYMQQQWLEVRNTIYDFTPLKINDTIGAFVNSLVHILQNNDHCTELHDIKHREIFILLRLLYTREQFAKFFYPIIGNSFNFKSFVLENYIDCHNLKKLIERSNMSPNVFMRKFKKEFGISAYQWMLKQMSKRIQHKAAQPGVTVKEIMAEVGIDSYSHFNRVCKRHFGQTPKQLTAHYQGDMYTK